MKEGTHLDIENDLVFPMPPNRPESHSQPVASSDAASSAPRDAATEQPSSGGANERVAGAGPSERPATAQPPAPPRTGRVNAGDVVDTFWDIPPINFPEPEPEKQDGPRHAAPKGRLMVAGRNRQNSEPGDGETVESRGNDAFAEASAASTQTASSSADDRRGARSVSSTAATGATGDNASILDGTRLFPESGPAAWERTTGEQAAAPFDFDFDEIIRGTSPQQVPTADGSSAIGDMPTKSAARIHKTIAVAIVAVVAVAALAVGGVMVWRNHISNQERAAALASCTGASQEYSDARKTLEQTLNDTQEAQSVTADQVADTTTVDTLAQAVADADAVVDAATCSTSLSEQELQQNAETNTNLSDELTAAAEAITSAAQAVLDSRDVRSATDTLQNMVVEAQTLLNDSLWAVADNTTRVTLEETIASTNTLLEQSDADLAALQEGQTALQEAMDAVNASMDELAAQQSTTTDGYGYYY